MANEKTNNDKPQRAHRATFSRDKRKGGFMVRVEGPHANRFSEKEVPVTMKDGTEKPVKLENVVWTGKDKESGKAVCLYNFTPDPIAEQDIEF